MATSAPTATAFTTSVPVWTPEVAASDRPGPSWGRRMAIQRKGRRSSQAPGQLDPRHHVHRLQVQVGLVEAVEQDQAGRPGADHPGGETGHGRVVRRQLHRYRQGHAGAHVLHQRQVHLLHLCGGQLRVGGDPVNVELEGVGAGVGEQLGVAGPAAGWTRRSGWR